jgi:hypothetical protein
MLATWGPTSITIELSVRIQVVCFQVTIDAFAAWARRSTPGSGLHHNKWCFVLLGYLSRREPGLLQRGVLAEQRFLQRSSHTLSLRSVLLELAAHHSVSSGRASGGSRRVQLILPPHLAVLQRYSITRAQNYALTKAREPAQTP